MFHCVSGQGLRAGGLSTLLLGVTLAGPVLAQDEIWTAEDPLLEPQDAPAAEEEAEAEGDITETIGEEMPAGESTAPPPLPAAASTPQVQLSGFARQSMELTYGELRRRPAGSPLLWRDAFLSRTQLALKATYSKGRHFEATVSGVLGYALHVAKDAPRYSIGTVDLTRGELTPDLREAYLGFYWPRVDLRIGQQRIAWGRSDFQSPNDVLNARDLRDPVLSEPELRHVPTMAIRSTFDLAEWLEFEAVVTPLFTPDRYDVYGSTWSVLQRRSPEPYQRFVGTTSLVVDPTVQSELGDLWRATELPPANGKGAAAGARLSVRLPSTDFGAYYHYGYDPTPYVQMDPQFLSFLATSNFLSISEAGTEFGGVTPALSPVLGLIDQGLDPYSARHVRRHHVGLDLATVLGPLILRVDAAYETRRVFYTQTLTSYSAPAAIGVLGVEYQTGSLDDVVLVELIATRLFGEEPPLLLGYERLTTAVAGTLRGSLGDMWGVDLRALVGLDPETYVIQPALRFKANDAVSVRLGALLVSGATMSYGWYFSDNDAAFLQLRYSF